MRRFLAVAFLGLAVAAATDASAQARPAGRRAVPDSVRARRLDSLRAAGVLDTARGRRAGPGGREGAGLMGIQLNDNEKAAVKQINEKYRGELKQLREANKGTQPGQNPEMREKVKAIMDRQQADIRGALTAQHQAQFDANIAKMKQEMAKRGGRRGGRPPAGDR